MKEYKRNLIFLAVCLALSLALGVANVLNFSAFELVCCMAIVAAICFAIGYISGCNNDEIFAEKAKGVKNVGEKSPTVEITENIAKDLVNALDKSTNV